MADLATAHRRRCGHSGPPAAAIEVIGPADMTPELAAELARLTRLAYAHSDPLPGLPPPDGQFEAADAVLRAVRATESIYLVTEHGRRPAALRVCPRRDCWRIGRMSVLPSDRHRGFARLLLDAVAAQARRQQIGWLELDAVVERCLPPRYAQLGFRVVSNWPSPDKPLSEVTMRRPTTGPAARVPLGWQHAQLSEHAAVAAWLLSGRKLLRVGALASGDPLADTLTAGQLVDAPGLLLAGVDLCRSPAGVVDDIRVYSTGGRTEPEHLMPRRRQPGTLALWRAVPGGEVSLAELAGG